MSTTTIKLTIGAVLFLSWLGLVVCQVPGTTDIITAIKLALAGLGAYHLNDRSNTQ